MTAKVVVLIIVCVIGAIVGFDIYLYLDAVPGNSISQTIIALSEKSMLVPWFGGFIMGALTMHFWDNYKEPRK